MTTFQRGSRILALVVASLACASLAQALNSQSWVASSGSDSNACTRIAPCATFQAAHDNTSAGGTINVVDPGKYGSLTATGVTISKAITIDGGGMASMVGTYTNAILVSASPSDIVIIRNLTIHGLGSGGTGIAFSSGGTLRVENVTITSFSGNGGNGIFVNTSAFAVLTVENSTITDCGNANIDVTTTVIAAAELDHVRLWGANYGVLAANGARITLRNSEVSLNSLAGVSLSQSGQGSEVDLDSTTLNYNGKGVQAGASTFARITNNVIMNNGTGLSPENGGQIISFGDNTVVGNFTDGAPTSTATKK